MDPIIGAATIAAGSSLLGGIFGSSAQSSANKTNIKLQREAQAWQESMWNKQNEYNTPAAQIQRMKDAGLNPALMYSQGNVGNADQPRSVAPAQVQPVTGLSTGISRAGDSIAHGMMQMEQVKQMRAQTQLLAAKASKEFASTMTPAQYQEMFRAKLGLVQQNTSLADAREVYTDALSRVMPGYYQQLQGESTQRVQSAEYNMQVMAYNVWMDYMKLQLQERLTNSRISLNSAQEQLYYDNASYVQLKTNCLSLLSPEQIKLVQARIQDISVKQGIDLRRIDMQQREQILKYVFKGIDMTKDMILAVPGMMNSAAFMGL